MPLAPTPRRIAGALIAIAACLAGAAHSADAQGAAPRHHATELWSSTQPLRLRNRGALLRDIGDAYPAALRDRGVTGEVLVNFRILPDGRVDSASVKLEHATDSAFVEPGIAVAKRLRFEPLMGRVVWIHFPIHFGPPSAQPPADGTWELWTVDELPRISAGIYLGGRIEARYPPAPKAAGTPGDGVVRFRINADSTVDSASVSVLQATSAEFATAAAAVARTLRFSPALVRRRAVPVWFTLPMHFRVPRPESQIVEGTYELSAIEVQPRLRNTAEVERFIVSSYPASMLGTGVTGTVKVRFRVQTSGDPDAETVQVDETSHPEFAAPAMEAAKRMRFSPARVNGRPVAVWAQLPIYFRPPANRPAARDSTAPAPTSR